MLIFRYQIPKLRIKPLVKTVITTSPDEAAQFIKRGGIVAFGTETVYGIGASVFDERAVAKIFEAKQRPADNPLIAHISDLDQLSELVIEVTPNAEKFIDAFFPGPLTIVLKKLQRVPDNATAGLDTIGVRMPKLRSANDFLRACEVPVVAPSANISGRPSPTTWEAVLEDLDGRIDCVLRGAPTSIGLESTVVDCTAEFPVLLRSGSVTLEQLKSVVPETTGTPRSDSIRPRSPGMKHKHYSPRAKVVLVSGVAELTAINGSDAAFIGISAISELFRFTKAFNTVDEYAREVFEFFRECDRAGIGTIYCQTVPETGIGAALMDRLRRAEKG